MKNGARNPRRRRRKMLVDLRLQRRFFLMCLSVATLTTLVSAILHAQSLSRIAAILSNDGLQVLEIMWGTVGKMIVVNLLIATPLSFLLGVILSFPVVGPLFRMQRHLQHLRSGEATEPCTLRSTDELQEFCRLLNEATEPLLPQQPVATETASEKEPAPV